MTRRVLVGSFVTTLLLLIAAALLTQGCASERYPASKVEVPGAADRIVQSQQNGSADEVWIIEKPGQQDQQVNLQAEVNQARQLAAKNPTAAYRGKIRPTTSATSSPDQQTISENDIPGSGALVARRGENQQLVPVPLKHTAVSASIAGYIATVDVTQQYHNPFSEKIEATYVFPLPQNAAVTDFIMTIGERKIRGVIRERDEARRIYEAARAQGHVASLMTQERPNIFTQSVANIEPGKAIDVNIKYFNTLEYSDGWYEFVFPMVVGPRFNPSKSGDGIGAKAHGSAVGTTGQKTEISYLHPDERSGHDISLALAIDAGVKVEQIECKSHKVNLTRPTESIARVELDDADKIPNKDFVLRYKVAGDRVKSAVMTQRDDQGGGYFTLMLFPPESLKGLPREPLELVFTLDVSGSMTGTPIEQSKQAVQSALKHMRPTDTFNVIRFAGSAEQMAASAMPANETNINLALSYIEQMDAGGGTMMIDGIRKSLGAAHDPERSRYVAFLTDGYIGNEAEILGEIHKLKGPTRIFSFGVGSATNRYLLDHMAGMGAGSAAYLGPNDSGSEVMAKYFECVSHPAMTDISIDWGGLQVTDVYPRKLPDLLVGRPVVITGRFNAGDAAHLADAKIRVTGNAGGEKQEMTLPLAIDVKDAIAHTGIRPVWARAKIRDLADQATYDQNPELLGSMKQVALEYGLMSAYTSFVAVDSSRKTEGDYGTTVAMPVPVPQGVRYETSITE